MSTRNRFPGRHSCFSRVDQVLYGIPCLKNDLDRSCRCRKGQSHCFRKTPGIHAPLDKGNTNWYLSTDQSRVRFADQSTESTRVRLVEMSVKNDQSWETNGIGTATIVIDQIGPVRSDLRPFNFPYPTIREEPFFRSDWLFR